jgi:hypothetical protein
MSAWTLSYPLSVLRGELVERKKRLAAIERHIAAVRHRGLSPHTRADCGCIQRRRTLRSEIEQLTEAINLCKGYVELCREAKRREATNG